MTLRSRRFAYVSFSFSAEFSLQLASPQLEELHAAYGQVTFLYVLCALFDADPPSRMDSHICPVFFNFFSRPSHLIQAITRLAAEEQTIREKQRASGFSATSAGVGTIAFFAIKNIQSSPLLVLAVDWRLSFALSKTMAC